MNIVEYENKRNQGEPAEARVYGILRGGFIADNEFYFFACAKDILDFRGSLYSPGSL
jgi:hypothetical protein